MKSSKLGRTDSCSTLTMAVKYVTIFEDFFVPLVTGTHAADAFLVRSLKDGELLDLESGMTTQVCNIICPDQNSDFRCQYSERVGLIICMIP